MELRQIFKIIIKNYRLILFVAVLVALTVCLVFWQLPAKYEVSLPLLIIRKGPVVQDQYSGYYALEAADDFGKTIKQWLADVEIAQSIFEKADKIPAKNPANFFRAQQIDPQQVKVRFSAQSEEAAQTFVSAIAEVLQQKADEVAYYSSDSISFLVIGQKASVTFKKYPILYGTLIAFCLGLVFGVFVVFAKKYIS